MNKRFSEANEKYASIGVDVESAIKTLASVPLSLHCWQGDDVGGFESPGSALSGGGIQVTGNYPGKATNIGELQDDLQYAMKMIPGNHRLSLHAIYGDFEGKKIDRNQIEPKHFAPWMDWSTKMGVPLDFNATCFSHPMANDGFTLSNPNKEIRDFWIDHVNRSRTIAAAFGKNQGNPSIHNLWIADGHKDFPADRMGYRTTLMNTLDEIFSLKLASSEMKDAVESKLFGIGSEAFVVGSHEFYMGYAMSRAKMICLDMGHFHPTESLADKLSSIFLFMDEILLHVSRPMRWDSDHVVLFNDDIRFFMQELVRSGKLNKAHIGLDFFDGTMNRIGAWSIGARSALKGLLFALLEPNKTLVDFEKKGNYFGRLATMESALTLPFGDVWDEYCERMQVPTESSLIANVTSYEHDVLSKRM